MVIVISVLIFIKFLYDCLPFGIEFQLEMSCYQLNALLCLFGLLFCRTDAVSNDQSFIVLTVATEANDGYSRFMRSAEMHGYNVTVLGLGQQWRGGDVLKYPGGGQKVNLLREALKRVKDVDNLLVMFVDSYDVVLTESPRQIMKAFNKFDANIVFSAEGFCWPDTSLADQYPEVKPNEKRYLNSGSFIGYVPQIAEMLSESIGDSDDDQLYYTKIFLDRERRSSLKIKLDTKSVIFQNLNGALDDVTVKFKGVTGYVYNFKTGYAPIVIHGNGPIKTEFNSFTNYLTGHWTPKYGCLSCGEGTFKLDEMKAEAYPTVFMAIFIGYPTAFLEDSLNQIAALDYPKDKIDVFIYYAVDFHKNDVSSFVSLHGSSYRSINIHGTFSAATSPVARNMAVEECLKKDSRYLFVVDGDIQLENVHTLQLLMEQNRSVIAPMMLRPNTVWSNFWGALSPNGYYQRSADYMEIVKGLRVGLWNVPYIRGVYLVQGRHINSLRGAYIDGDVDTDMAFCKRLRERVIFMYVDNRAYFGHMTENSNFETSHMHNDMYSIMDNRYTWEKKYLHPDYYTTLYQTPFSQIETPCPDVFWFPMVKPVFCTHLIEEMENYGQWSGGKNNDPRLAGGYENVPTVDIHMNQVGFERQWLYFLREFIVPYSARAFDGYKSEGRAIMNFVVRYRPGEQDHLRPHDDASTFTINIALNQPRIDFEGGGCKFLRYNCSVVDSRVGWMLMHPGRLTHHHEGLRVTRGTRYIMVAFVDP